MKRRLGNRKFSRFSRARRDTWSAVEKCWSVITNGTKKNCRSRSESCLDSIHRICSESVRETGASRHHGSLGVDEPSLGMLQHQIEGLPRGFRGWETRDIWGNDKIFRVSGFVSFRFLFISRFLGYLGFPSGTEKRRVSWAERATNWGVWGGFEGPPNAAKRSAGKKSRLCESCSVSAPRRIRNIRTGRILFSFPVWWWN